MLRIDLENSISYSDLELKNLSPFQRILLTTDGTVTEILEAQLWEPIKLVKLFQEQRPSEIAIPYLEIEVGTEILIRKILLQGNDTGKNHIYAESILVPEKLDKHLQDELTKTNKPLGRLMIDARTETFREILSCKVERAEELGEYFNESENAQLISRTYRVFTNGKPIMLITEKFPQTAFRT